MKVIKDIFFIGLICALLGVVLSLYEHEVLGVLLNLFGLLLISISGLCYSNPKKLATEKKEEESDSISDVDESAPVHETEEKASQDKEESDKDESDKDESDKEEDANGNSDDKARGDESDENIRESNKSKDSELEDSDSSQQSNENESEEELAEGKSEDDGTSSESDKDESTEDEETEDEPVKDESVEDKPDESTEDEATEDEPTEDEPTEDESTEDESTEDDDTGSESDEEEPTEDEERQDPLPEKCISTTSRNKGNEQEYLLKGEYSDHEYEVEINLEGNWMSYYVDGEKRGLVSVQEKKIEIEKDFQYMKDAILSWVIVEYEYLHAQYEENLALALEDEKEEALEIVKRLVSEDLPSDRELSAKDNKNYYSINLDGNARKWVCRLYFKSEKEKYAEFPGQKNKHKLKHVSDFDKYKKYQSTIVKSLKKRL